MKIVWDEVKQEKNLATHGLDFAQIETGFDLRNALILPTYPGRDGRRRFLAIGLLGDEIVSLIFAPLGGEAVSAISFRPSSRRERRAHATRQSAI